MVLLGPDEHWRRRGLPPGVEAVTAIRTDFSDGEHVVSVPDLAALTGRHVLVVQTTAPPQPIRLVTLIQLVDIAVAAGAASVVCCTPYLCYQRQDRRSRHGEALTARTIPRLLAAFGVRALLTIDRHSTLPALPGEVPVLDVCCAAQLAEQVRRTGARPDVVVSADAGGAARAGRVAARLGLPTVVMTKRKDREKGTWYEEIPDSVDGRHCLIVDDLCSGGSTLMPLHAALRSRARDVSLAVTHILTSRELIAQRLPGLSTIVYTDSCADSAAPVAVLGTAVRAWCESLEIPHLDWPDAG